MGRTIRLFSWNVNGIRAAYTKGLLDWLRVENPDILCLQEIKATEDKIPADLKNLPDYHAYFNPATRPGYSGVALYTKEEPLKVDFLLGREDFDGEGRHIIAEYADFILFTTYFPNGGRSDDRLQFKLAYYDHYLDVLGKIKHKPVIICGDVNTAHHPIDLARPKENEKYSGFMPIERAWLDRLFAAGYIDTFRMFNQETGQYTWWDQKFKSRDRNVGWRIDYFIVSEALRDHVRNAAIHMDVLGSDHCPISLDVELPG